MEKELVTKALEKAANKYQSSPATTNAGRILRFIVGLIPVDLVVKAFAHKLSNK